MRVNLASWENHMSVDMLVVHDTLAHFASIPHYTSVEGFVVSVSW